MVDDVARGTVGVILGSPSPAELRISPAVQGGLGRAPRTFADWAARNVAAFH